MVIRQEHFAVFDKALRDRYAQRVASFLRRHLPKHTEAFSEAGLLVETHKQIELARQAQLRTEADIASFVVFRFMAGAKFRSQPRFAAIWDRQDLDGGAKVASTRKLLSAHKWTERV